MELPKKFPRKMSASWTIFCGIIFVKVTIENSSGLGLIKKEVTIQDCSPPQAVRNQAAERPE